MAIVTANIGRSSTAAQAALLATITVLWPATHSVNSVSGIGGPKK